MPNAELFLRQFLPPAQHEQLLPLPALPPLHTHAFGSRFLPHLPSQPLCAVYLDLPPSAEDPKSPATRVGASSAGEFRRNGVALQTQSGHWGRGKQKTADEKRPRATPKQKALPARRVLLIGTAEGVFACELKKEEQFGSSEELRDKKVSGDTCLNKGEPSKEPESGKWNGGIRVVQIWSGLGIYQFSILSSGSATESSRPTSPLPFIQTAQPPSLPAGILLALTAPVPKSSSSFSGMASSALEHLASSSSSNHGHQRPRSSHSSSGHAREASHSHHSQGHTSDFSISSQSTALKSELSSGKLGSGGGGGPGCAVPPLGTGVVRMWSLEALRKLATLALDGDLTEPLDLVSPENSKRMSPDSQSTRSKISSKLKRAWITLGDSSSDRAARKAASDGFSGAFGIVDPLTAQSVNGGSLPREFASAVAEDLLESNASRSAHARSASNDDSHLYKDGALASSTASNVKEITRSSALDLALNSVAINSSPGGGSGSSSTLPPSESQGGANLGTGPSFSSLFGEDSIGGGHSSESAATAKHRSARDSNGVLFYAVHEASPDEKGRGTWYLALATSKTIMLYEAQPPKKEDQSSRTGTNSSNRSFRFLRELYAPFCPNAISFVTANTSEEPIQAATAAGSDSTASGLPVTKSTGLKQGKQALANPGQGRGILIPQYSGGSAAPLGWRGADLSLFVSFGKRAVMIRVSDSNVRDIELMSASQAIRSDASLAPPSASMSSSFTKDKPDSSEFLVGPPLPQAPLSRKKSSESSEGKTVKSWWVGASTIEAKVRLRQKKGDDGDDDAVGGNSLSTLSASDDAARLAPKGAAWKHSRKPPVQAPVAELSPSRDFSKACASSTNIGRKAVSKDKALPSIPAPLNLSFDAEVSPKMDRNVGSRSASGLAAADRADLFPSDSSSEEYELDEERLEGIGSLSLVHNASNQGSNPPSAATSPSSSPPPPARGSFMQYRSRRDSQNDSKDLKSIHTVSANLALLSKGTFTQILPSPLPADLAKPQPLGILHWTEPPSAVTGLARVIGVERESSRGFNSTANLKMHQASQRQKQSLSPVMLRISVSAVGFISSSSSSRIEMQRTTIRTHAVLPFKLDPSCELELNPVMPSGSRSRSHLNLDARSMNSSAIERGPNLDLNERVSLQMNQNHAEMELGYPGGLLLSSPANGSKAHSSLGIKPWRPEEAAGDGGAFAWSYRGGEDYRIFYVGAEN